MSTVSSQARLERLRTPAEELESTAQTHTTGRTTSAQPAAPVDQVVRVQHVAPLHSTTSASTSSSSAPVSLNARSSAAAASFATNTHLAVSSSRSSSSEDLTASFMKLNALDPNDSVQTQISLISAQAELAKLAIRQAQEQIRKAEQSSAKSGARDLFAKSLLAADPGLVKLQETLVKKGWMSSDYVAYHIKFARDQEAKAQEGQAADKETIAAAQAQMDSAIAMLKDCGKRMQALLARQAEEATTENRADATSIDGVPVSRLQTATAQAMSKIYAQLSAIEAQDGALGVLTQVEDVARAEFTRALTAAGMEHPEELADFLTANVVLDVSSASLGGETGVATGRALSDLGAHHDGGNSGSSSFAGAAADVAALTAAEGEQQQTWLRA